MEAVAVQQRFAVADPELERVTGQQAIDAEPALTIRPEVVTGVPMTGRPAGPSFGPDSTLSETSVSGRPSASTSRPATARKAVISLVIERPSVPIGRATPINRFAGCSKTISRDSRGINPRIVNSAVLNTLVPMLMPMTNAPARGRPSGSVPRP